MMQQTRCSIIWQHI